MSRILCYGSLNIDNTYTVDHFVAAGETMSSLDCRTYVGGKGLNQSIALARAGAEVWHAGAIGEDGTFLLEYMAASGVHTEYVQVLPDVKTGHAIIQRTLAGENCILLFGGANQANTKERIAEVLSHFEKGDILLLQNEVNELRELICQAHEKGMKIVLNPSPMNEKIPFDVLSYVSCFLVNEVEAAALLGCGEIDEEEGISVAQGLLQKYPGTEIVLTLGGKGAVYASEDECFWQPACKVKVVDTTGAGDTFTGYFLQARNEGMTAKDAMELASKAASIAVSREGAAPSIPVRDEVLGE